MLKEVFDGKEYCIYLFKDATNTRGHYTFKLKWRFAFYEIDNLPMPSKQIMELLQLDKKEYADLISLCKLDLAFA